MLKLQSLPIYVVFSLVLLLGCPAHADLGLDSEDFNGNRTSGRKVEGEPVTGDKVTGKQATVNDKGLTTESDSDDDPFSSGTPGTNSGTCDLEGGDSKTEGSGCDPCEDSKTSSINPDQFWQENSFVNLFTRQYQDEQVDMSVKVPGGLMKIYRIHNKGRWYFEHEYNRLDLTKAATGNIVKSTYTYKKKADGLYHYKTFTIEKHQDHFRWQNKKGSYSLYSKEGRLIETGNQFGALSRYSYKNDRLISSHNRFNEPVYTFDYNTAGKVIKATDAYDRTVEYSWKGENLVSVTNVLGHIVQYKYSPEGQLVSKSDETGRKFFITYHPDGAVRSFLSRQGGGDHFSYGVTAQGDQYAKVTSAMGNIVEYWYYPNGETRKIKENGTLIKEEYWHDNKRISVDETGSRTTKIYDKNDNLLKIEFMDGTSITNRYDSKNNLIATINELGVETRFSNNQKGLSIKKFEAYGTDDQILTDYHYDQNGNLTASILRGIDTSLHTWFSYDKNDNLIEIADPLGGKRKFTHDYMGNIISETDPAGLTTQRTYDAKGTLLSLSLPNGQKTFFTYDGAGRQITATGSNGVPTRFHYDFQDNLIKTEDSTGGVTTSNFDKDNRLTKKVDEEGKYQIFFYDGTSKRIRKIIDGSGNEVNIFYGGFADCGSCPKTFIHKPVRIEFPTFARQFTYDTRGRIKEKSDIFEDTILKETYTYDKAGQLISRKDPNGYITQRQLDSLGRLTAIIDPSKGRTLFNYSTFGNLSSLTDAKGQTTRFEYNDLGLVIKEIRPLGNTIEYSYGPAGRLLTRIDSSGQQISFLYSETTGSLESYVLKKSTDDFLGKIVNFTYNQEGQLTGYEDGTTSATYELDPFGRRIKTIINYGNFSSSHSYSYYRNGLKKSYTGPDGLTQTYSYTPLNQLQAIDIEGVGQITFTPYNWLSPKKIRMPGVQRLDVFDPLQRLTRRIIESASENEPILDLGYKYNALHTIVEKRSGNNVTNYTYDSLQRLTGVTENNTPLHTYKYDPVGNRVFSTKNPSHTYDANNQLLAVGDTRYTYDNNGNTIRHTDPTGITDFEYNLENRLARVIKDGKEIQYYYDPFGRRLFKEIDGKKTWFDHSDEGLVAEYDDAGNLLTSYSWKPGTTWSTSPVMLSKNGQHYFYQNDHLGAPRALTDTRGNIVWQAEYDVFGALEITTREVENNLRFPGQYFDGETGLYYNWHRYYEPENGRYISADPIGLMGGVNLFAYAANNPLVKIDPHGLDWRVRTWGGAKVVIGIVSDIGGAVLIGGGGVTEVFSAGSSSPVSIPAIFGGAFLIGFGNDQIITGWYELLNGQSRLSLTEQTIIALDELDREYDITGHMINAEMTLGPGYGSVLASGTLSIGRLVRSSATASRIGICQNSDDLLARLIGEKKGALYLGGRGTSGGGSKGGQMLLSAPKPSFGTSPGDVSKILFKTGKLPDNFITKKQAKALGWNPKKGNLAEVAPGKSIGGDRFRNKEGLLPDASGRTWYEADLNYSAGYRGSERLLYSSDGLIYYTGDHYKTFQQLGAR